MKRRWIIAIWCCAAVALILFCSSHQKANAILWPPPSGAPPAIPDPLYINEIIGIGIDPSIGQFSVNGVLNVKAYGASGSGNSYTCTQLAGTATLTCTTATDFVVGQVVAVPTAGAASPLVEATPLTVTQLGTTGAVTVEYAVCTADPMGGIAGCATSTITNANATIGSANPVRIVYTTGGANAQLYLLYRQFSGGSWQFIQANTAGTVYDIGYNPLVSYGWPATPPVSGQGQVLYEKIVSGSGTIWTTDSAATSTANAVTVIHDDADAVRSASVACGAAAKLYFPTGTYHLNRPLFFNTSLTQFNTYAGTETGFPNLYPQGIVQVPSNCTLYGDGRGVSVLKQDYMESNVGGENVFGLNAGLHEPPFFTGATAYALNNRLAGDHFVTTTTASNASNFAPGDYVFYYGGATLAGSYISNEINQVVASDPSTGIILLASALEKPLPLGTVGTSPAILNLNGQLVHDVDVSDMTFSTPNGMFVTENATYHTHFRNLDQRINSVGYPFNGGFRRDVTWDNCNLASSGQEWDMDEDVYFRGGSWRTFGSGINVTEASATVVYDKTNLSATELACQSGVSCPAGMNTSNMFGAQLDTWNWQLTNSIYSAICNSANNTETPGTAIPRQGGSTGGLFGEHVRITDNTITTNCNQGFLLQATGAPATAPDTDIVFTRNRLTQNLASNATGVGIQCGDGCVVNENRYLRTQPTGGSADTQWAINLVPPSTSVTPFEVRGNRITMPASTSMDCIEVADPGSPITIGISLLHNICENGHIMVTVGNPTNTVVALLQNLPVSVTTNYSPATLADTIYSNLTAVGNVAGANVSVASGGYYQLGGTPQPTPTTAVFSRMFPIKDSNGNIFYVPAAPGPTVTPTPTPTPTATPT